MNENCASSETVKDCDFNHLEPLDGKTQRIEIGAQTGTEDKELRTPKDAQISPPEEKPKRIKGNGAARFRKACERALRRECEKIAEALIEQACAGDLASARLLVKVIETAHRRRRKPSARVSPSSPKVQPATIKEHLPRISN